MTKSELIKLGLDEATAVKVEAESLKELGKYTLTEEIKNFVPKSRFDEVNDEKNKLTETLKERDKQLEDLKNSTGDIEKMKKDITDLQAANTEKDKKHAAEIKTLKINSAVEAALNTAKAKNQKAVRALLDLEKAELDNDGKVKGLDDQMKKLQGAEDSKFLFETENKKPTIRGASPGEGEKEDPDQKVDFSKMSYEELAAYAAENPDVKLE